MTAPKTKLLFVCSQNRWRSLTAEKMFEGSARYDARSAGTEPGARVKINRGHVGWADLIFVMERRHSHILRERFGEALDGKKLVCLRIPDDYHFMDEELVEVLRGKLGEHLDLD